MKLIYQCPICGQRWSDEDVKSLDEYATASKPCPPGKCIRQNACWRLHRNDNPVIARPLP